MQQTKEGINYFFVDESGDPVFYDKKGNFIVGQPGCSKILIIGFIKTKVPHSIRTELYKLRAELQQDPQLQKIPSMEKTLKAFHAKDDCPEVREKVFSLLPKLDFTAQIIVARKTPNVIAKFNGNPNEFYDSLITNLFKNVLHKTLINRIYFATRGNRKRQEPLRLAIEKAVKEFENKWHTQVNTVREVIPQSPYGEPCLQVIDYVNWAVQRAYNKGEMRYFEIIRDKIRLLVDIYDYRADWSNFYNKKNPFHINKISPL